MKIQLFNPPCFHYGTFQYRMLPTIGLPTLAAWFNQRGHYAEVVDLEGLGVNPEQFKAKFAAQKERWPDVIGITALTISHRGTREIMAAIREAGFTGPLVAGGVYFTLFPERAIEWGADLVITGECEGNVIELIESGATGIHKGESAPIEDIPIPAWRNFSPPVTTYRGNVPHLLKPRPGISMWSRGCPFKCIFCANTIFGGRPTRYRTPQMIEAEMIDLKSMGVTNVYVYDDEMVGTKLPDNWMQDIADRIAPLGLKWITQGRCSQKYITPSLMADMKRAGCTTVFWGVESFSPRILKAVEKHTSPDDIFHTLRVAKEAGIDNAVFTMIGNYQETDEDLELTCAGLKEAYDAGLIQLRQTSICTPMDGTKLAEYAKAEGWYHEQNDFGEQMLQRSATPWMPAERMDYWMSRFWQVCPVGLG